MRNSAVLIGFIAITLGISPMYGGTAVLVGAPGDAGVGDCIPFGCSDASIYQQVFDSSLFSSPITIAGLTFFLRNFDNTNPLTGGPIVPNNIYPANYTITFSVVDPLLVPVDGLDTTVDNNINPATAQTFFIGFLSDPVSDHFSIQTTPANYFFYDPAAGNLLMDIRQDGTDPSVTMYLDINSASGGQFSSAFDSNPHPAGCPDGSAGTTTGCARLDTGLVTQFDPAPDVTSTVPEPATAGLWMSGVFAIGLMKVWKRRTAKA